MKNKFLPLFLFCSLFVGCNFFNTIEESISPHDYNADIKGVSFNVSTLNVNVRDSEYIKLTLNPSANQGKCSVSWEYDKEFIEARTDNSGAVITGVKAGSTYIRAKCNGISATCLITVIANGDDAYDNPYIYSNYSVIQLKPEDSTIVTASLYGGSIADMEDFI